MKKICSRQLADEYVKSLGLLVIIQPLVRAAFLHGWAARGQADWNAVNLAKNGPGNTLRNNALENIEALDEQE